MDYPELIAEAANLSGIPEFVSRAAMFTEQAESDLNRILATRQMEKTATLTTDADGIAPLPADFLRLRNIKENGNIAVQGDEAWTEVKDGTVDVYYIGALPSIVSNGTNWLLQSDPSLYLQAVLLQAYTYHADQRVASVAPVLQARVASLIRADKITKHSGQRIDLTGVM